MWERERSRHRVCGVGLASLLCPGASERGGLGGKFSLSLSFPFSAESSLKPVRLPTCQNPHMPCHCVALVTLELGDLVLEKRWGWVNRGAVWDCRWTASEPQSPPHLSLLRSARSDSQSLHVWLQEGDLCEGMRIGKGERLVQWRPFHATQLPGSQSSEMPKESCISFIAGQTEQPGVEGPLEDNIP